MELRVKDAIKANIDTKTTQNMFVIQLLLKKVEQMQIENAQLKKDVEYLASFAQPIIEKQKKATERKEKVRAFFKNLPANISKGFKDNCNRFKKACTRMFSLKKYDEIKNYIVAVNNELDSFKKTYNINEHVCKKLRNNNIKARKSNKKMGLKKLLEYWNQTKTRAINLYGSFACTYTTIAESCGAEQNQKKSIFKSIAESRQKIEDINKKIILALDSVDFNKAGKVIHKVKIDNFKKSVENCSFEIGMSVTAAKCLAESKKTEITPSIEQKETIKTIAGTPNEEHSLTNVGPEEDSDIENRSEQNTSAPIETRLILANSYANGRFSEACNLLDW